MKTRETKYPTSYLGIRISIWEVVCVIAFGAVGALSEGTVYGDACVFGAFFGALIATSLMRWVVKRDITRTQS